MGRCQVQTVPGPVQTLLLLKEEQTRIWRSLAQAGPSRGAALCSDWGAVMAPAGSSGATSSSAIPRDRGCCVLRDFIPRGCLESKKLAWSFC